MNGKQEDPINPIASFTLEAHADVQESQGHYTKESLNTAQADPIKEILLMTPYAESMSCGFALRIRRQDKTAGRMLKGWKTSF